MREARPIPPGSRVVAAVSGGPDSTALLIWLVESGVDVLAAHYDHALRPGSEADVDGVAVLCNRLGVPLVAERRSAPLPAGSLQAAARALRYGFLERARRTAGRELLCLGHTADDVVEGAVLHLLRGAGLAGMRGMPERRLHVVRPLLHVWRVEIERYLAARGVQPLRDPANADTERFARARVRHLLLPALERDRPGIGLRLRADEAGAAALQERVEREGERCGGDRAALRRAPRAVRMEAYRRLYGRSPALARPHLEAMDRLTLRGRTGAGLDLPAGARFRVEPDRVSIDVAVPHAPQPPAIAVRPCAGCADPGAAHLRPGPRLWVGYRSPGLRMRPVGSPGTRKLQDILTDAKVPRHLRDHLPLVFADDRLAWVPGIAVDADAAAPPGAQAWHVSLVPHPVLPLQVGREMEAAETQVVLSGSAHSRSPVT